ncbi:MAG: hypothetical protein K0Q90_2655 [Paenibacillaceae bacterium]|jgi:hypothetical protein|nr:hypothetical protein [Paenibacillaceae bacterium]
MSKARNCTRKTKYKDPKVVKEHNYTRKSEYSCG